MLIQKNPKNPKENYIWLGYCCSCSSVSERFPGPTHTKGSQTLRVTALLEPTCGKGPEMVQAPGT